MSERTDFKGRVAVVTGSSAGIGLRWRKRSRTLVRAWS